MKKNISRTYLFHRLRLRLTQRQRLPASVFLLLTLCLTSPQAYGQLNKLIEDIQAPIDTLDGINISDLEGFPTDDISNWDSQDLDNLGLDQFPEGDPDQGYLPPDMIEDFVTPIKPLSPKEQRLMQNPQFWPNKKTDKGQEDKTLIDAAFVKFSSPKAPETITAVIYQVPGEEGLRLGTIKTNPDYTQTYTPTYLLLFDKPMESLKRKEIEDSDWATIVEATKAETKLKTDENAPETETPLETGDQNKEGDGETQLDIADFKKEILPTQLYLVTKEHPLPEILKRDGGIAEAQFLEDKSGRTICEVKLTEIRQ